MRPLVLLPGLGNTTAVFDPLVAHMARRPLIRPTLVPDQTGSFKDLCDFVEAQIGSEPVDMLGYSMGGYVALNLALRDPSRIASLALVNSRAADDGEAEQAGRVRTIKLLKNERVRFEGMTPKLFARLVGPKTAENMEVYDLVRAMAQAVGRFGTIAQITANQSRPNVEDRLGELTMPALIIGGALDTLTPPGHARRLAAGLPKAQLHIFEDCGHIAPLERPAELASLLEGFL